MYHEELEFDDECDSPVVAETAPWPSVMTTSAPHPSLPGLVARRRGNRLVYSILIEGYRDTVEIGDSETFYTPGHAENCARELARLNCDMFCSNEDFRIRIELTILVHAMLARAELAVSNWPSAFDHIPAMFCKVYAASNRA